MCLTANQVRELLFQRDTVFKVPLELVRSAVAQGTVDDLRYS